MAISSTRRLLLLAAPAIAGCSDPGPATGPGSPDEQAGIHIGNGVASLALDLRGYDAAAQSQFRSLDLADGTAVDAAWLAVERVRLRPGASCDEADEQIDAAAPHAAELTGTHATTAIALELAAGPYCGLRFELHVIGEPPAGAPSSLADLSVLVEGRRGDGVPFRVESDLGERFELRSRGAPFELVEGAQRLFLAFDLGAWVAALDLDAADGSPIVISDDDNKERLEAFEEALRISARMFRDADADGDLDAGEHAEGKELAEP